MIVAPQSHPPRALLLGCSLRHAARPSPIPEGPSMGYPGEGPGHLTLLQQDRRGPESRSLGLACSSLRCRKTGLWFVGYHLHQRNMLCFYENRDVKFLQSWKAAKDCWEPKPSRTPHPGGTCEGRSREEEQRTIPLLLHFGVT